MSSAPGSRQAAPGRFGGAELEAAIHTLAHAGRSWSAAGDRIDEVIDARLRAIRTAVEFAARYGPSSLVRNNLAGEVVTLEAEARLSLRSRWGIAESVTASNAADLLGLRLQGYRHEPTHQDAFVRTHPDEPRVSDRLAPHEVTALFNALDERGREFAEAQHARLIGRTNGIPTEVRDRCNRRLLDDKVLALSDASGKAAKEELEAYTALKERLDAPVDDESRQLFLLDLDVERGGATVADGNPDFATHVVTLEPGAYSGIKTVPVYIDAAGVVHDTMSRLSPSAVISVIADAWPAPTFIGGLFPSAFTDEDADALTSLTDGLVATHQGPPSRRTIIPHSYGASRTAKAANNAQRAGTVLEAHAVVFWGSAGVGLDHVSQMGLPEGARVFAGTAENDPNSKAPSWIMGGPRPIAEEFGAEVFDAGEGTAWPIIGYSVTAHQDYWNPDSPAMFNAARIALGKEPITFARAPR